MSLERKPDITKESKADTEPQFNDLSIEEILQLIEEIDSCIEILENAVLEHLLDEIFNIKTLAHWIGSFAFAALVLLQSSVSGRSEALSSMGNALGSITLLASGIDRIKQYGNRNLNSLDPSDRDTIEIHTEKLNLKSNQTIYQVSLALAQPRKKLSELLETKKQQRLHEDKACISFYIHAHRHPLFAKKKLSEFLPVRDYLEEPKVKIKRKR